ncbi:PREDICTED: nucleolin 2-like isoform X2 [Nelumbo nucifera]|uniref:Nucleolin 2-like isoform X2 n=1 Tax=Nelumbo nucifera TaxID=4432 RepID=A0A1U8AUR7_NELNU|nr:PREDICTED: nucleolin 2-like isoform X2 [Nelumbo nucifera]
MAPKASSGPRPKRASAKTTPKTSAKTATRTSPRINAKISREAPSEPTPETATSSTPVDTTPQPAAETPSQPTQEITTPISPPEPSAEAPSQIALPEIAAEPTQEITSPTVVPETNVEPTLENGSETASETKPEITAHATPETTDKANPPEDTNDTTAPETADGTANPDTIGNAVAEATGQATTKSVTKKTIKVVKKVIKKKVVPKRVAKAPDAPSNEEFKKEEAELNPLTMVPTEIEKPHESEASEPENPGSGIKDASLDSVGAQSNGAEVADGGPGSVTDNPVEPSNAYSMGAKTDGCMAEYAESSVADCGPGSIFDNLVEASNADSMGAKTDGCKAVCAESCAGGNGEDVVPMDVVEKCEASGNKEEDEKCDGAVRDEEMEVSERRRRRRTEIFIGGLDKDAKEEDIRKVFEKIGEIVEIRLMMNSQTGKNKGYAFLRYASAADAKRALIEYAKVEVCGKQCGTAPVEGNDTIFLGNIDKKWKKEDILKVLEEIGIEKIDTVTVMPDPSNAERNRGFAFIELETNRDAQNAYKKLQKKDAFGKNRNISVAWAEPLQEPDEEEMLKVKSVFAEGLPTSWDEEKMRKHFKEFGEIEKVVLARNMHSAKRKDFAFINYTTREAALACIESINKEGLIDEGSKVNVRASLAKPAQKGKQSKGGSKPIYKDNSKVKPKVAQRDTNVNISSDKGKAKGVFGNSRGDKKSSTTNDLIQVPREQANWRPPQIGLVRGFVNQDYAYPMSGVKRPFSALDDDMQYLDRRVYPCVHLDSYFPGTSYGALSQGGGTSLPYYQQSNIGHTSGTVYGASEYSSYLQRRQGGAPYGSGPYRRY